MAVDEDKIRLLLELQGFDDIDQAIASMSHMKGATTEAQDALSKAGEQTAKTGKALDDAAGKTANFGRAAMETGRIAQDFAQGGLAGVLNNVEGLAVALGGGVGLAGVLTLAGVALWTFKDQIRDFLSGPTVQATTDLERLKEKIKELDGKTAKLAVDYSQLERAREQVTEIERALKAVDALGQKRAPIQEEAGKRVGEMLPGGPELQQNLIDAALKRISEATPEFRQIREDREKIQREIDGLTRAIDAGGADEGVFMRLQTLQGRFADLNERQAAIERGNVERARTEVGSALDAAKKGDAGGRADLAQQLRGIGEDELADRILAMTPVKILGERMGKVWEKFTDKVGEAVTKEQGAQKEAGEAIGAMVDAELQRQAEQARRKQERASAEQQQAGEEIGRMTDAELQRQEAAAARKRREAADPMRVLEGQTADMLQRTTGADAETSQAMARRVVELQMQGIDIQTATHSAIAEMQAAIAGNAAQLATLRQQALMLSAQVRRLNARAGAQDDQLTIMQFGWGR